MIDLNSFICGDCMDYLPQFPDKYFDLAVVDPPYGIGMSGEGNCKRGNLAKAKDYKPFSGNDSTPPDADYFSELFRVSKNQIIFGANHFISRIARDSHCWIVWDKENYGSNQADCELAWTSFDSAVRLFRFQWNGMLQGNMKHKEYRIHPTQKPIALYEWILSRYAKKGDIILDTHVGSASSLIACHNLGFDYIGLERDEYYYSLANNRLNGYKSQMSIFDLGVERD